MRCSIVSALLTLLVVAPAGAVTCRTWTRLDARQRTDTIGGMIDRVVTSHVAQQYNVSKQRVARCLESHAVHIENDFDDACADRRTAGMRALENIFNRHVWSCVR